LIHNVLLIDKVDGGVVTRQWFWKIEFTDADIQEFLVGWKDLLTTEGLSQDTPIFVENHKVFHSLVGDELLLMFVTDGRDEDKTILYKVREGAARITTALRGNSIGYIRDNLEDILGELIFTRFKISFVGSGGVGKSTLMRLLFGKEPAPGGYVPTINVAVDSSETIQFGTYLITIWDFAGQAVFQDLWSFYFGGTDVIFLITDSSFRNVMQTKGLLRSVRKEAPAVPLFIIANKQDLPESMRGDKIQRLLGAHTFAMVATDKTRREEFIRFMLEVATKTVGVTLPEIPVSDMIVVRRRTEEVDASLTRTDPTEAGFEDVPYVESESGTTTTTTAADTVTVVETSTSEATTTGAESSPELVAAALAAPPRILHLMLIVQGEGQGSVAFHLDYEGEEIDVNAVASLIAALDTFGGIDAGPDGRASSTDALETIEHEGNLVMIEKSTHFVMALIVTNDSSEEEQRGLMTSLLVDIEQDSQDKWDAWEGDPSVFEPSVFDVLSKLPLSPVSLDYIARSREAGRALPFNNMEVGRALVAVKNSIEGSESVGGIVRSIDLPREMVLGSLQIMNHYGWIDFQVEVAESSILRKVGPPPEEIVKAYGQVIVQFIQMCDGTSPLEDIVRKLNVSMTPMKFVTQKLVLGGILEVVA
jgi:small GTP-binding protein